MSLEALTWALNLAPVPEDKSKPSAACAAVLIGLANHADPDGRAAFPSIDTLIRYTRLSRRTVVNALDRLEKAKVITPCDPEVIAAKIKRADRRPQGFDLAVEAYRDDLDEAQLDAIERSIPMLRHAVATIRARRAEAAANEAAESPEDGVQPLHVVDGERGATSDARGATDAARGATSAARGAAAAPEPSKNHPGEPSPEPSPSGVADAPPMTKRRGTRLPDGWQPSQALRDWFTEHVEMHHINPNVETEKFIDYWRARPGAGGVKLDWDSTWRNWMRTAAERRSGPSRAPQHPRVDQAHRERVADLF